MVGPAGGSQNDKLSSYSFSASYKAEKNASILLLYFYGFFKKIENKKSYIVNG